MRGDKATMEIYNECIAFYEKWDKEVCEKDVKWRDLNKGTSSKL
jgi:hypothetical protein